MERGKRERVYLGSRFGYCEERPLKVQRVLIVHQGLGLECQVCFLSLFLQALEFALQVFRADVITGSQNRKSIRILAFVLQRHLAFWTKFQSLEI